MIAKLILTYFVLLNVLYAADEIEYTNSKNGLTHPFFGYKNQITKEKDDEKLKKEIQIPKNLEQLTVDELNKLIDDSKKTAISFPTDENMHKYISLQNYAIKKSEDFSIKWQQAILKDSSLDLSAPAAKSTFARNANTADKANKRETFWKENINKIGIVAFFDKKDKEVNTAQNKVLYFLNKDYPELAIRTLYKDEHLELAKEHNIGVTPDIFIIYKNEDETADWHRIKAGLTTKNELLDNIDFVYQYFIAKSDKK